MEFKYINDRNKTPNSKLSKKLSNAVHCDSPFKFLPNFSTPPSRFTRIVNPFEQHLIDGLHLPTFSPSVFAKVSTPKTDEKFKWTIDDISSLKPADIDEGTISQHVFEEDPHTESLVQQKIDTFFKEKVIVPSPMTEVVRVPLITETDTPNIDAVGTKKYSEGSAQTVLTLPPILPDHIEEALKPFFTYTEDQQKPQCSDIKDSSLYRQLFEFEQEYNSPSKSESNDSSPAHSTGLSPFHLSPVISLDKTNNPYDMPELRDCTLSPICRKSPRESRSACRLNFSSRMSIDASVVPDIANQMSTHSVFIDDHSPQPVELLSDSTVNWDMEYKHVSLLSDNASRDSEKMDVSNSNTPHSKIFPSQRKRLSDSFKYEEDECNKENEPQEEYIRHNRKLFRNDVTDGGYHTETGTYEESFMFEGHVFASTPSKKQK